jgi:glycerophosphoryl diester phosphodiesterase
MIGDCQALATPLSHSSHFLDNPKPFEQELAERRAAIITASPVYQQWLKSCPAEGSRQLDQPLLELSDAARAAIIPRMLETMQHQNSGYSVIDGFPVDEQHVRVIPLDFQPWEIVLASDGYPFLCNTLAESEERLARQREEDPLNIGAFKATKAFIPGNNSFDDRAFIRFQV